MKEYQNNNTRMQLTTEMKECLKASCFPRIVGSPCQVDKNTYAMPLMVRNGLQNYLFRLIWMNPFISPYKDTKIPGDATA